MLKFSHQQSRNTINNTLHRLELAMDRNNAIQQQQRDQQEGEEEDSADANNSLEFMLRSVGQDISSNGPAARGGLLNQVKAFNAQLEATARRLER